MAEYEKQNERALICTFGLPANCELPQEPLDVLTDLVVLLTFSLAQAWWCEILEKNRWEDTVKSPWFFVLIPVTHPLTIPAIPCFSSRWEKLHGVAWKRAIVVSALGRIRGLEPWEYKHPGEDFEFSALQSTLYILGVVGTVSVISWHFIRAYMTLEGTTFVSGGKGAEITKPDINLHALYTGSRIVLIVWAVLFTVFLLLADNGFSYRGPLLAWVLSLLAVFPVPVSKLWLALTTGVFLQGIASNRLRFLGCDP